MAPDPGDPTGRQGGSDLAGSARRVQAPSRLCAVSASMARTQEPDFANSQFFICFADTRFLDYQYTGLGLRSAMRMENVDQIKRSDRSRIPTRFVLHEGCRRRGLNESSAATRALLRRRWHSLTSADLRASARAVRAGSG